ncbi:MAG: MFS transporter [Bacteroidetes bacterium]|nr:MFS transporter [Bacteroidota bacterium]
MAKFKVITPYLSEIGQQNVIRGQLFTRVIMYITTGALMQLFANDVLGYSPMRIASILAIIPMVAFIRFPILSKIRRIGYVKMLIISSICKMGVIAVLMLIPLSSLSFSLYLSLLILFSIAGQLGGGTVWQPLLRDITTNENRGRFFSRMRFTFTLTTMIITAVIPFFIEESISFSQYRVLLGIALLGLANYIFWIRRVPEIETEEPEKTAASRGEMRNLWKTLKTSRLLRRPLLIFFCFQFSLFPILILYFRQMLNIPSSLITIYTFMTIAGSTLSLLIWGRIADAIGFKPMLIGLCIISMLLSPIYLLLRPISSAWMGFYSANTADMVSIVVLLASGLLYGAVQSGAGIAMVSIQHAHTTSENSLTAMSLFSFATVIIAALQSMVNGFFLEKIAIPAGILWEFRDVIQVDYIKLYLIFAAAFFQLLIILAIRKMPNLRAYYGVVDFFSALKTGSLRSMLLSRNMFHGNEVTRSTVVQRLHTVNSPLKHDTLHKMLSDPSYDVKVQAVRALSKSPSSVQMLLRLLEHEGYRSLHDHIAWALGEIGLKEAEDALIRRTTEGQSDRVKAMAVRALAKIGSHKAIPSILKLFRQAPHTAQHLRASACKALIQLDCYEAAGEILAFLRLMTARIERYELLNDLCIWYGLPNSWLIEYTDGHSNRGALLAYITRQSRSWRASHTAICKAVEGRDIAYIRQELSSFKENTIPPKILLALQQEIIRSESWEPVVLLSAAVLIFKPKIQGRLTLS